MVNRAQRTIAVALFAVGALAACVPDNTIDVQNDTDQTVVIWRDIRPVAGPSNTPSPVATIAPHQIGHVEGSTQAASPNQPPPYGEGCVNWILEARTVQGALLTRRPGPVCVTDSWTVSPSPHP